MLNIKTFKTMKKILMTLSIIVFAASSYAKVVSSSKVPVMVKANFSNAYPEAKVIRWETTDLNDYKVEFKVGDNFGAAYYDANGNFIEADNSIEWQEVPLTGRMEVYHLGENKILNVLKIVNAKKEVFYQVDVKKHFKKVEVLLDKEGNIIRTI